LAAKCWLASTTLSAGAMVHAAFIQNGAKYSVVCCEATGNVVWEQCGYYVLVVTVSA